MSNLPTSLYSALIYIICLPLALMLGYFLATPLDPATVLVVSLVLLLLIAPLLLRWHHVWLIVAWNMSMVVFFLPGRPPLWLPLAGISLLIAVLHRAVNAEMRFLNVPAVTWPLMMLVLVVLITSKLTAGFGLAALGGQIYGGRRYVMLLGAVLGYFALVSHPIPLQRAKLYVMLFFLGGATMAVGSLAGLIDSRLNFLFLLFPVENASSLSSDVIMAFDPMSRVIGLPFLSTGVFCAMLIYYGVSGIFDFRRPWRLAFLLASTFLGMYGGFRSVVVLFAMTFAIVFYLEGLMKTRLLPIALMAGLMISTLTVAFSRQLPLPVQRSLAFLPIDIDPMARESARASTLWRVDMWKDLVKQIPDYLILGKGYAIDPSDLLINEFVERSGGGSGTEVSKIASDYHSGPLSVILPFGIFGSAAFLWFLLAGLYVLHRNYKYGDPAFRRINTFLFAYFAAKAVFFFGVFGSLYSDMAFFTGLLGISVSLNRGVAKPALATEQARIASEPVQVFVGVRKPAEA